MILLWKIFVLYTRVALFSWGGGPASLALMQRETTAALWVPRGSTEAVPWATPIEFSDAIALGSVLPGPIAPKVSAYVGYKMAGVPGAIAATAGTVLPTTLLMLFMIVYFFTIKDGTLIRSMLRAVRPVVVGFLLWTTYEMAYNVFGVNKLGFTGSMMLGMDKIFFVLVAFGLLTLTKINPAFVIFGAAALGGVFYR